MLCAKRRKKVKALVALGLGAIVSAPSALATDITSYSLTDIQASASDKPVTETPKSPADNVQPSPVYSETPVVYSGGGNKKKKEELTAAMKSAYGGLFYGNKFGYLNSPLYDGPFFPGDSFKGLMGGKLDLGGEARARFHSENNHRGLGLTGVDDDFWLSRLRLFANYRVTDNIRVYGEYLYADSGGERALIRPIEENRGEAQNLFVDAKLTDNLLVRGGRQELLLGDQRLVSPLDWANTRRTFDGVRAIYNAGDTTIDTFYTNPVNRSRATGGTNEWDSHFADRHFYGVYGTQKGLGIGNAEAYYIGFTNNDAGFDFHTIGSRVYGGEAIKYEVEGGVQFGTNSDGSGHGAGFVTAGLGRTMDIGGWKPTIWGWYDYASGGNAPFAAGDDSFHHYFPLAHKYNGFMDLFGRRNLNDVNFQFITPLGKQVKFLLWYHYFFLDQQTTPYSVLMTPFDATGGAGSKDLGHEIDTLFTINLNPRNSMLIGYSFFAAGNYYSSTAAAPTSADADFFYMQYQMRF